MTDQPTDVWNYDSAPTEPGWYPVVLCWDGEEGQWPGTAKWTLDGKWEPDRPSRPTALTLRNRAMRTSGPISMTTRWDNPPINCTSRDNWHYRA